MATKKAVKRLVRGMDGRMHVRYVDLATGELLNDIAGYQVVEIAGSRSPWADEMDVEESTTEDEKKQTKATSDSKTKTDVIDDPTERPDAGDLVGPGHETYTGPDQWGPGVALQKKVQDYVTKEGGIKDKLDKVESKAVKAVDKIEKVVSGLQKTLSAVANVFDRPDLKPEEAVAAKPAASSTSYGPAAATPDGKPEDLTQGYASTQSDSPFTNVRGESPVQTSIGPLETLRDLNATPDRDISRVRGGETFGLESYGSEGLNPDIRDQARQAFNQVEMNPNVISTYRSPEYNEAIYRDMNRAPTKSRHSQGDALDIDTVGMTEQEKAAIVDSMMERGFTSVGVGPNSIHFDARPGTPRSWTYQGYTPSPEIQEIIKSRQQGGQLNQYPSQYAGIPSPQTKPNRLEDVAKAANALPQRGFEGRPTPRQGQMPVSGLNPAQAPEEVILGQQNNFAPQGPKGFGDVQNIAASPTQTIAQQIASGSRPITTAQEAMAYAVESKGMTPQAAAGMVGNMMAENSAFDAILKGDNGASVGAFQFQKDARDNLAAYVAEIGGVQYGTTKDQIDFVLDHALNPQSPYKDVVAIQKGPEAIFQADNPINAAMAFADVYERPSNKASYGRRKDNAQAILDAYVSGQTVGVPQANPAGTIQNLEFQATKAPLGQYGEDYLQGGRVLSPEDAFNPNLSTFEQGSFVAPSYLGDMVDNVVTSQFDNSFTSDFNNFDRHVTLNELVDRAVAGYGGPTGSFAGSTAGAGSANSFGGRGTSLSEYAGARGAGGIADPNADYSGAWGGGNSGDSISAGRGGVTSGGYSSNTWGGSGGGYNAFDSSSSFGGGWGGSDANGRSGGTVGGGMSSAASAAAGGWGSSDRGEFG